MMLLYPFASHLDLLYDKNTKTPDGQLFCPQLFKKLVNDCYLISKFIHTSYTDVLNITPMEKNTIIEFIKQDNDMENKRLQESIKNMKTNKH